MINMNSPTVQAMLQNTPQGIGNMPAYFGSVPTVTSQVQNNTNFNSPYPSPKDMISMSGVQNIYNSNPQLVGGYNPGFQSAFNGYYNPYMGYGQYGGICSPSMDRESMEILEVANINGLSFREQLENNSRIYKTMSRITSRVLGRSEEEAKMCEETFDLNRKPKVDQYQSPDHELMHVQIRRGDEVVMDIIPKEYDNITKNNTVISNVVSSQIINVDRVFREETEKRRIYLHANATERTMDNADLFDFFNNHMGILIHEDRMQEYNSYRAKLASGIYNGERFGQLLKNNSQNKSDSQIAAIAKYTGRYGIMPDGRPVSPGHDPAVAESFSMDPLTGKYTVTAPNFIQDRLDKARQDFMNSIES